MFAALADAIENKPKTTAAANRAANVERRRNSCLKIANDMNRISLKVTANRQIDSNDRP
jgi:hypothetical protein